MEDIFNSPEYEVISKFYNTRRAKRSNVPLMNHIDEGIKLLDERHASVKSMLAFCLHPIVQNDEGIDVSWSEAYQLAVEYKIKANSYLCRPNTDHVEQVKDVERLVGKMKINCLPMSRDCALMLIADKLQNQKDFIRYHRGSHARSTQLDKYFNLWLAYLHTLMTMYDYD